MKPDSGTAQVNGFDLLEEDVKVRDCIGIAFEGMGIYTRMTARENLKFFGKLHGMKGSELSESVDALLQAFNFQKEADQPSSSLNDSGKRRLTVACAAVHKPALLMIDIQTSELDMVTTRLIDSFITDYPEQGRTVIRATRSLVEARLLCKKMAVLRDGFLVAKGTLAEIEEAATQSGLREAITELDLGDLK
jgi:sodium transport system ATP-binding protein